ncbi:threonine ammonia-lyase, biosynthetic [Prochlorococcus sp. MIT 1300]|uniref:threonine ammonia-lyase, biosynthetic n=1 Tax=Prochlorococcus sp. MIT 1300 TaxID=3096218 RepID=UPI002A753F39|nr:threonine ammonia-lyase, biosynthetic [Prochlorococcus sp. MIT 1300]
MNDYLQKILRARVYDVAHETPLELAKNLSRRLKNQIWLKREDLQPVFSFKLRGAYNRMAQLSKSELSNGVIASSAGNHAQGVALSALQMNCRALIVMPVTTPAMKINAVKSLGAEVILFGETYDESYEEAKRISKQQNLTFIHPFDDPEVIAGQGTIGLEILRQCQNPPDAIYVAVGGGGLIGGIAVYVKSLWPETKVIGVESDDADAMTRSLKAGKRIELDSVGLFADGVAVRQVGEETFALAQKYVDSMVTVCTDEICAAIKDVFEDTRSILEPAGALAIAGLKADIVKNNLSNKNLIAVACGANMNFDRLRFVAERAELGEEREAMFAVEISEHAGSLKNLCQILGNRSLTEFSYRMSEASKAQIFMGVQVNGLEDRLNLCKHIAKNGLKCLDLSDDELAKMHLRHMVGGRLPEASKAKFGKGIKELLYRFEFPEKPGALMAFVNNLRPDWSISIFHYRNHGADVGRIVVGVLVKDSDLEDWKHFLNEVGYRSWEESQNPAYKLFLGGQTD